MWKFRKKYMSDIKCWTYTNNIISRETKKLFRAYNKTFFNIKRQAKADGNKRLEGHRLAMYQFAFR